MKKIKSALIVACGVCMLFGCQVNAEEAEKGTRENPYAIDEEIPLGNCYDYYKESFADVTVTFGGFLTEDDLLEQEYDTEHYEFKDGTIYILLNIEIGDGSTDDGSIYLELGGHPYSTTMYECYSYVHLYDPQDRTSVIYTVYTHRNYECILECWDVNSVDALITSDDLSYLRLYHYDEECDSENDETISTWVDLSSESTDDNDSAELVDGMRQEFIDAMNEYEEFFDKYCEFMTTYSESDDTSELLTEYMNFLTQYTETMEALEAWESEDLNDAELLYYTQVTLDISQKLLEVAS